MAQAALVRGVSLKATLAWAETIAAVRCKGRRPCYTAVRRPGQNCNPGRWHVTVR